MTADRALAHNVRTAFVLQFAGFAASYALNVLLAQALGSQNFGEFSFVRNWIILIGTLGTLGTFGGALRFI
ncbi:MAG: hypothetical protein K8I30_21765, partial [Anaerolineae bacterium]|nr:hypothetical protein [Anaerolineae bacterium]